MKKNEKKLEFRKTPNMDPHMIWFLSLNLVAQYMYIVIWMDSNFLGFFLAVQNSSIGHPVQDNHQEPQMTARNRHITAMNQQIQTRNHR